VGNAAPGMPSSIERVDPTYTQQILKMAAAMPPEIRTKFKIFSGFRDAVRESKVNPGVKDSQHSHGLAVDVVRDPDVINWINQNGRQFNIGFPLNADPNEDNHMELLAADGSRLRVGGGGNYVPTGSSGFSSGIPLAGTSPGQTAPAAVASPQTNLTRTTNLNLGPRIDPITAAQVVNMSGLGGGLGFGLPGQPRSMAEAFTQAAQQQQQNQQTTNTPPNVGGPLPLSYRIS
jgi:hypothetical protein